MPLELTKRLEKGSPLTPGEMDANLTGIETAVNTITERVDGALDADGELVDEVVTKDSLQISALARGYFLDVGTVNLITVNITPSVTMADLIGVPLKVKVANTITAACQVKITGTAGVTIGTIALRRHGNVEMAASEIQADQIIEITSDGDIFQLQSPVAPSTETSKARVGFTNLAVDNVLDGSNNPTAQLTVAADEIVMKNAAGGYASVTTFAATVDAGTVGANGRDFATARANQWLYIWAIAKSDLSAKALLLSTSSTLPTLATAVGYETGYYCLVGQVYDTTTVFGRMAIRDHDGFMDVRNVFDAKAGVGTGAAAALTALAGADLTNFQKAVPPNAKSVRGNMGIINSLNGVISVAGNTYGIGEAIHAGSPNAITATAFSKFRSSAPFVVPVLDYVASGLWWRGSTDAAASFRIDITGYTF